VSLKCAIPASSDAIAATPSRPSQGNFPKPNKIRVWPGTRPPGLDRLWTIFVPAVVCCLMVAASGCGSGVIVLVSEPRIQVTPGTVNFGEVGVGVSVVSNVTITNPNPTASASVQVNVSGQTFSLLGNSNTPISIPAGRTSTLKIGFTPVSATNYSGQLALTDMSGQTIVQVPMQGQGSSQSAPQLAISAPSLSFGSETVNTATTQTLTLTSSGTSAVTVSSAAITGGGFTIVGGTLPATLNPNQSLALQVQFAPTATGAVAGQLSISSDSTTGGTTAVALSGTGTAVANPQLTISASSLSFGNETVNTAKAQTLTLISSGTSAVTVSSAAITGAGFTIVGGTLPATLNPNQTLALQVQFAPTATGSVAGQLSISSNSTTGGTAAVALNGTGTAAANPQLTISASSLSFGSLTVNTTSTLSLTLTSSGTSAVTVSSAAITGAGFTIVGGTLPATLNPNQTLALQVQFAPTATGAVAGQLSISSNSTTGGTAAVALSGTGTAAANPQLTISASSLSFGSETVNSAKTLSVTLTSSGTSAVTVSSAAITGAGFTIVGGTLPATLNPNQTLALQVQFAPTATGAVAGQLSISSNSTTGGTAAVALSGTGTATANPQLTISASSLSFGSETVNTASTLSVTLTSSGTSAVTVSSAAITGAGFTIVGGTLPATLNPNQSLALQVQFAPTATGAVTGQLSISSNSTTGGTAAVALSGTGTAAANPQLTLSASSLSFGSETVNTAKALSVTLTSSGTSAVTVSSAAITGAGFTIVGGTLPATLNPNQTLALQVQFAPTATGSVAGQLSISSNSTTGGTAAVALNGTGTAAANPQLTISASSLSFGSLTVNTTSTLSLTLTSSGTSAVTVSSAAITGAGFTIVGGTLPATLNPNQTLALQVQFAPTATGAVTGQLSISSNSTTGGTAAVALSGTGTAAANPQLTLSVSSLSFGSLTVNTASTLSVTLTSSGTSAVTVSSAAITGAGFTIVAQSFPVTLNPNQSVTLQVQFAPTATGAVTGQLSISSNSTTGGTAAVALSGTGTAANPQLTISASSLSFGSLTVNTASTLSVTLTSSGTSAVTVSSAAITGAGFTIVGGSFPVTLNPTQTLTLQVQFDPTTAGAVTGQLAISSNSNTGGTADVALSGTGTAVAHSVDLSWTPPSSSADPVAGYNIYRAISGGSLALVNSSPDSSVTYVDSAVVSGTTYNYVVKSVDSSGVESVASNEITAAIP
jgi:hypothetical protein